MRTLIAALFAAAATIFSPVTASATIFTTSDFAPAGGYSNLSAFDFTLDVPDEAFTDGTYNYSFGRDARRAYFTNSVLDTALPTFSLSFAGAPQYGTATADSSSLSALNGTRLGLFDAFFNDFSVFMQLGTDGSVTSASISGLLDAALGFNIAGGGDSFVVQVASLGTQGGCFGFGCSGTVSGNAGGGSVPAPGGLAIIAFAGLIALRRRNKAQ